MPHTWLRTVVACAILALGASASAEEGRLLLADASAPVRVAAIQAIPSWASASLDAVLVLDGRQRLARRDLRSPGRVTVVTVRADACEACTANEKQLRHYARSEMDVAVRIVALPGARDLDDARRVRAGRALLRRARSLSWFRVYDPDGRKVYEGSELEGALSAADAAR